MLLTLRGCTIPHAHVVKRWLVIISYLVWLYAINSYRIDEKFIPVFSEEEV